MIRSLRCVIFPDHVRVPLGRAVFSLHHLDQICESVAAGIRQLNKITVDFFLGIGTLYEGIGAFIPNLHDSIISYRYVIDLVFRVRTRQCKGSGRIQLLLEDRDLDRLFSLAFLGLRARIWRPL